MWVGVGRLNRCQSKDRARVGWQCQGIGGRIGNPTPISMVNLCHSRSPPAMGRLGSSLALFLPAGNLVRASQALSSSDWLVRVFGFMAGRLAEACLFEKESCPPPPFTFFKRPLPAQFCLDNQIQVPKRVCILARVSF
ncbi:hypothetical protein ACLOJK_041823 [Asimina triloba]